MPKEYRDTTSLRVTVSRRNAHANAAAYEADGVEERDVTEWRRSEPESDALVDLRRLRALDRTDVERELNIRLSGGCNPYEQDTAILFHLIQKHGAETVRAAVNEMLCI